jgi:hypothetical protein
LVEPKPNSFWDSPSPLKAPGLPQVLHHPAVFAETLDLGVVDPVVGIAAKGPVVDLLRQLVVGLVQVAPDSLFAQLEVQVSGAGGIGSGKRFFHLAQDV